MICVEEGERPKIPPILELDVIRIMYLVRHRSICCCCCCHQQLAVHVISHAIIKSLQPISVRTSLDNDYSRCPLIRTALIITVLYRLMESSTCLEALTRLPVGEGATQCVPGSSGTSLTGVTTFF